jgi:hypothetical protein
MTLFENEYQALEELRPDLVHDHEGDYVVIMGSNLLGVYPTAVQAYEAGLGAAGPDIPFLLERVRAVTEPAWLPAYVNGLLDASPAR